MITNIKILVTGGAGFIGSNLVKQLVNTGNKVTVLDNFSSGFHSNLEDISGIQLIEGDIRDPKIVETAVKGNEIIFHLAASVGNKRSIDFPVADTEINVLGTIYLLEAARKFGVRKIVTSSSAGIFGELKTLPINEDHPIEPDTPYGCTKLCEEKLCLSYAKLYPIEAICLRYFNVYGPNQRFDAYGNVIPIFVFKMLKKETLQVFGDGEQTRDFIHVNDVVQANILAAETIGVSGAFNIGSGKSITINYLLDVITRFSPHKPKIVHTTERPGDVLHSLANINHAKKMICFKPRMDIETGLSGYIQWARNLSINQA